ncbi:Pimeloyl-ACP methyl ester carboxylesterase [Agrococcus baldri]|uniref:Pimeloyl-ACP methyl ester carboxylesterase n=1 Tax=Agrococcus baldri TaxID=153730 RepID=A0AA94HML9_9MICO|nr:alpha/beta hydrolase [Agrococcus baldri]SFS11528.1 Pimeloyl-ACP methyl ester carboxylesterase [Agrococcus baldri]
MPYIDVADDQRIFYTEKGDGPPALLIHGWSCDGSDWSWLVSDLSRDHRTITIDNRGHGRSTAVDGQYSPALFAADAAKVIEQLGLERPVVIGHSMGTIIASTLAAEHPDLVGALVLVDPVYGMDAQDLVGALAAIRQAPHAVAEASFGGFYGERTPAWLPEWHRRRILATDEAVVRDALVCLYEGEGAVGLKTVGESYLRRRQAPTLAIYAGTGAAIADWDRTLDHGPSDEILVWSENGHFLHQEEPERFATEVRRWLEKVGWTAAAAALRVV